MSKRRNLLDSAEKRRSLQNVAVARGRLKGALQDVVTHSGDEESGSEDDSQRQKPTRTHGGSRHSIAIPHQTYIMKLFDRSVDLARFDENTPLYPICRSWMQNQPRANPSRILRTPSPVKREYNPEMTEQYRNREIRDVRAMPKPEGGPLERCPSPLACQLESTKERLDSSRSSGDAMDKAALMAEHKVRWGQVRNQWQSRSREVGQRYKGSFDLLDAMLRTEQKEEA
ncbi:antolefinin [Culex quinquefasciatus]|uniref:Antolefinin n=1 Tax=Culex quinquefasciatus TaxID=7176 RepID=B0XJP1_CULQU|nr:antolefinin [Culex quinquefasciatus]|eukprot:XP_001869863.1 antolefinin [Culex quinquefasciatus]